MCRIWRPHVFWSSEVSSVGPQRLIAFFNWILLVCGLPRDFCHPSQSVYCLHVAGRSWQTNGRGKPNPFPSTWFTQTYMGVKGAQKFSGCLVTWWTVFSSKAKKIHETPPERHFRNLRLLDISAFLLLRMNSPLILLMQIITNKYFTALKQNYTSLMQWCHDLKTWLSTLCCAW